MNYPIRKNIKDVFNAFMVEGAAFSKEDIPFCPTTGGIPSSVVTYREAKLICRKEVKADPDFRSEAYVCFYEDDQDFDGPRCSIWTFPKKAYGILKHFKGIITPDFSTYQDFPMPLKIYNTYRMRAFGHWFGSIRGKGVVNNVRWGTRETWDYCFDGIGRGSLVAIGTVGGSPRRLADRERFEDGFFEMIRRLRPSDIIVYGSAKYPCFELAAKQGIRIHEYPSSTASYFKSRGCKR